MAWSLSPEVRRLFKRRTVCRPGAMLSRTFTCRSRSFQKGICFKNFLYHSKQLNKVVFIMPSYGRGGVGNIQAVAQQAESLVADVEANETSAEAITANDPSSGGLPRERQQYVHAGRGGAGNLYTADQRQEQQPSDGSSGGKPMEARPGMSSTVAGRGGAGNYEFAVTASEQQMAMQRQKEEEMREMLKEDIVKDVGEQLAVPPKAKLARSQVERR